jgi:O-acetyl-ADP-ribose deacetylase (regulator of RNase III)
LNDVISTSVKTNGASFYDDKAQCQRNARNVAWDDTHWMGMMDRVEVVVGDITQEEVDAIVNAANNSLLGGGGVDGAIHRAAGPALLEACRALKGCATGETKITKGFGLRARYVIHTVGPVWSGGQHGEDDLLASCWRRSLESAEVEGFDSIAFPSISTGLYAFPVDRAARIAAQTVSEYLTRNAHPEKVRVVAFDERTYRCYQEAFGF